MSSGNPISTNQLLQKTLKIETGRRQTMTMVTKIISLKKMIGTYYGLMSTQSDRYSTRNLVLDLQMTSNLSYQNFAKKVIKAAQSFSKLLRIDKKRSYGEKYQKIPKGVRKGKWHTISKFKSIWWRDWYFFQVISYNRLFTTDIYSTAGLFHFLG